MISLECDCELGQHFPPPPPPLPELSQIRPVRHMKGITPSTIDKYSRVVFPLMFIAFNGLYWSASWYLSKAKIEDFISKAMAGSLDPEKDDCFKALPRHL